MFLNNYNQLEWFIFDDSYFKLLKLVYNVENYT